MKWNSDQQAYFGTTSDGKQIRVEGDEMAEAAQDAGVNVADLSEQSVFGGSHDLLDPDVWQTCIGANQNVSYVKK